MQSSIYCFKGIGEIDSPPEKIKDLCKDFSRTKEWDPLLKESRVIETIDDQTEVIQMLYQTNMCLLKTSRDFCLLYHWRQTDNGGYILAARSVSHPKCPEEPGFIRGEVLESGYHIQPKNGNPSVSIVTYVTHVDLKGIPSSIINIVSERQPLVIAGLRKTLTSKRTVK